MLKRVFASLVVAGLLTTGLAPADAQVSGDINVRIGPPAPIVERVPVAPGPGYYWRPGVWRWNGSAYAWRPGGYVILPAGRTRWVPGRWVEGPRGWFWRRGYWV